MRFPRATATLTLCAAAVTLAQARSAHADGERSRFTVRLEGAAGAMLPDYQRQVLGYNLAIEGTGRIGISIVDMLAIQISGGQWIYPRNGQAFGGFLPVTGGLRFEPRIGSVGRLFIDANAGAAFMGQNPTLIRFAFDAGVGFEFAATRWLGIGPFARYGHVLHTPDDVPSDSMTIVGGISIALRYSTGGAAPPPPRPVVVPPPPRDTDHDGVNDPDDQCVSEPAGAHPDPARRGCPLLDSDSDGVFDNTDLCVHIPAGEHPDPDRAGCPDSDDDADGVTNHTDACPTVPQGVRPDPARPGCPTPDRDNDTVPDATDHCPDQFGAPSADPNRNGCPGLVRVENGQIRILNPVFFATNSDRILPRSFPVLDAVADALRATPEIHRVGIEGHTDDQGPDARNLTLSQRRATSVMLYLTQHGIEATRLEAHGFGETRPMQANITAAGRAANRRVEFHIIDPAQPDAPSAPPVSPAPPAASPAPSAAPTTHGAARHHHHHGH